VTVHTQSPRVRHSSPSRTPEPEPEQAESPAYELRKPERGRPPRSAPTEGQLNLDGSQVHYLPSTWSEPDDDQAGDALEVVELAAAEAETLDAELAPSRDEWIERQHQTRRHLYSQHLTAWGAGYAVRGESRSVKMALVAHLTTMGPFGWHALPLASVGEPWGEDRAPMSRATGRLLKLGLLDRIDRGPGRPSEYRITSKLIELTERAETPETQRARIEHTPCANRAHVVREKERTTTRESDDKTTALSPPDYVAEGAACVDCGGAVKTNPNKPNTPANPRCKPCHDRHKHQRSSDRGSSWDHTTAPGYRYNPYGTPSHT